MFIDGLGFLVTVTIGMGFGIVSYYYYRRWYEKSKFRYRKNLINGIGDTIGLSIIYNLFDDAFDRNELYEKVKENLGARGGWPLERKIYKSRLDELVDDGVVKTLGRLHYLEHEKIPEKLPEKIKDFVNTEISSRVSDSE